MNEQRDISIRLTRRGVLKIVVATVLVCALVFLSFNFGLNQGYIRGVNVGVPAGYKKGYEDSLRQITDLMKGKGVMLNWTQNADGSYRIDVLGTVGSGSDKSLFLSINTTFHLNAQQFRPYLNLDVDQKALADASRDRLLHAVDWVSWQDINQNGVYDFPSEYSFLISESTHPMNVTNVGKDWVEQQLFNPNASQKALYLASSGSILSYNMPVWLTIPDEINASGLARALGAYVSTGVGAANISKTFSVTGTISTQMYAVYYDAQTSIPGSLVAAEQQGAAAVKNFNNGDTLILTVQWSHS